jgi:hypothetical protein
MSERNRLAWLARQAVTGLRDLPGNVAWVVRKVADRRAGQGAPAEDAGATATTATAPADKAAKAPATTARKAAKAPATKKARKGGAGSAAKPRTTAKGPPTTAGKAAKASAAKAGTAAKGPPRKAPASGRDGDDLAGLTRAELLRRARELDVEGRSSMSKAALVEAVRRAEAAR